MDTMANLDTDLLKPTEAASRLRVSRSWVYEAAKAGRIPSVRLGGPDGPLRFLPEDVERWLERARSDWLPGNTVKATGRRALTCRGHDRPTHDRRARRRAVTPPRAPSNVSLWPSGKRATSSSSPPSAAT